MILAFERAGLPVGMVGMVVACVGMRGEQARRAQLLPVFRAVFRGVQSGKLSCTISRDMTFYLCAAAISQVQFACSEQWAQLDIFPRTAIITYDYADHFVGKINVL